MPRTHLPGPLFASLLFSLAPLGAQTFYTGVLDHIEVRRWPRACHDYVNETDSFPPTATFTVSRTLSCNNSSTALDLTLNVQTSTPKAESIATNRVQFETGVKSNISAKATFSIPGSDLTTLGIYFPAEDLSPSSGFKESNGTCVNVETKGGKNKGSWTSTASAADCERNRQTYLYLGEDGNRYYYADTEVSSTLLNDGTDAGEGHGLQLFVRLVYKMAPPNKITITKTTPAAGERQDPYGEFSFSVNATSELLSDDDGDVVLRLYEGDGSLVVESPRRTPVKRGSNPVSLSLGTKDLPNFQSRGPRNPVKYRLIAVLLSKSGQNLAQSDAVEFPVWCDLKIDHLEGIQVTQHADNTIPLVANKPTRVRVYATVADYQKDGDLPDVAVVLRGYRNGTELPGSPLESFAGSDTAYFTPERSYSSFPSFQLPDDWNTGTITVRAQVNPQGQRHYEEQNAGNNESSLILKFQDRPAFSIRTLRVCHPGAGGQKECAKGMGGEAVFKLANMLPVALDGPNSMDFDAWDTNPLDWPSTLNTAQEWDRLMVHLEQIYLSVNNPGQPVSQLMAWLPAGAAASIPGGRSFRGLSSPVWAGFHGRIVLVADPPSDEDERVIQFAIAHEVGHNLGLTHTDPPPACGSAASRLGEIGMQLFPYQFFEADKLHLMLYCSADQIWISPSQYMWLWNSGFEPPVSTLPPAGPPAIASPSQRQTGKAAAAETTCALIQGTAHRETPSATFDSVLSVPCSTSFANAPTGNHCLRFFDSARAALGEWCFPITFTIPEVPGELSERGFVVRTPLPAATRRIALMRGDLELASRTASTNPPQVSFTTPQSGDQWTGGERTLSWNATDADGDALTYSVQYSPDNRATWLPVKMNFTETSLNLDSAQIRGGKNVYFRVLASDGFYTATADAGPVAVLQTPAAAVSPSSLDFLNVLSAAYAFQRVTIRNAGSGLLTVKSATAGGAFQVRCLLPIRVAAGESGVITVQFQPTAAGTVTGTLNLATDDPAHPTIAVPLAGDGAASNTPEIEAIPPSLDFGTVTKGKSADLTVRVRNRGPAALTLSSVAVDSAAFRVAALAKAIVLQAGATYDVAVTFAPSALGATTGNLTLSSDDPKHAALKVPLKGSAVPTDPIVQVQPANLNFGDVAVGAAKDLVVGIANSGGFALTVKTAAIANSLFSLADLTAPLTLGPGSQANATVRFKPTSAGSQSGALTLTTDDPEHPSVDVPLTGVGVGSAVPAPKITITPAQLDFGNVTTGTTRDLNLTIGNTGGAPLIVTAISSSNPRFAATGPALPFNVAAGAQQVVTIRFSPAAAGVQSGTLTVAANDPAAATTNVAVTGTGAAPATATILFSDSFNRPNAEMCALGVADMARGGSGAVYYMPLYPFGAEIYQGTLWNGGRDYSGVQFTLQENACAPSTAAWVRQDLTIQVELLVPGNSRGDIGQAGPYFRSRAVLAKEFINGGNSAGYWVQLHNTGEVKIKRLNPEAVVAVTGKPEQFDNTVYHTLEMTVEGNNLQVALDGKLLSFTQSGAKTTTVAVPPVWDGPPAVGTNHGATGILFGAEDNRGNIGDQRARNLVVSTPRPVPLSK